MKTVLHRWKGPRHYRICQKCGCLMDILNKKDGPVYTFVSPDTLIPYRHVNWKPECDPKMKKENIELP